MAAAAAEMAAGASMLDNVPVTWDSAENAIAHALSEDPGLELELTQMLDASLALNPDHNLAEAEDDDESLGSDSPHKDSDTASTSSSVKENEDISQASSSEPGKHLQQSKPRTTIITIGKPAAAAGSGSSASRNQTDKQDSPSLSSSSSTSSFSPQSSSLSAAAAAGKPESTSNSHSRSPSSASSASQASKRHSVTTNGSTKSRTTTDSTRVKRSSSIDSATPSDSGSGKGTSSLSSKNPLRLLKRLSKSDKNSRKKKQEDFKSEFTAVVVDRLPQVFVAKYLGQRSVPGVCGLHHVRKPVDQMVRAVKDTLEQNNTAELPLLYVVMSPKGIDMREHKRNKVKGVAPTGLLPIDFISYGVQDIKYWRVFVCIVVNEMSSQSRTRAASCHAFLCDSAHNGRKMALALGAAFGVYSKKLKKEGRENNFSIELRPPDQLAEELEMDV